MLRANAFAAVADRDFDEVAERKRRLGVGHLDDLHGHLNRPHPRHRLARVDYQIHDGLTDLPAVAFDPRGGVRVDDGLDVPAAQGEGAHLVHDRRHVDGTEHRGATLRETK